MNNDMHSGAQSSIFENARLLRDNKTKTEKIVKSAGFPLGNYRVVQGSE